MNELAPANSPLLLFFFETIRMNDIMVVEHLGDQLEGKYISRELYRFGILHYFALIDVASTSSGILLLYIRS